MYSKTTVALSLALIITLSVPTITHATKTPSFTNIVLLQPSGDSEPELSIGQNGQVVSVALSWTLFQTNAWVGAFGQTPTFQGGIDSMIQNGIGGGEDADVDFGSTGTVHVTTLRAVFTPVANVVEVGVSPIPCQNGDLSNIFAKCPRQILDFTQADRPWITSDGPHVWISYHDSGSSTLIHVWRSDDDGFTWKTVGDPIPGHDSTTGNSTFNNDQGKIVADPVTHNVYNIYAAGVSGVQKGTSANFNNIYVSVSTDLGATWTPHLVFSAPVNQALNNIFPILADDPLSGSLYAGWSNLHNVFISKATNQGSTWSAPVAVASSPVNTSLEPWVAVRSGTVDVVYYGTSAASNLDSTAVWNVYLSRSTDGASHVVQIGLGFHPQQNRGVCTDVPRCARGT